MKITEMSISGGAMILVTALVRLIAGDRLPRRAYIALWVASALRLLLPVKITSGLSLCGLLARSAAKAPVTGTIAAEGVPAGFPALAVIWLAGTAMTGAIFVASYIRCVRTFRVSLPTDNGYITRWLAAHSIRRHVDVRVISGLKAPLTYGVFRPVILLPLEAESWDPEGLGMVLCHEHTHIRRFDGAVKILAILAACAHWWNPAVWLMAALLDRDVELACDGEVVDRFGPECRTRYARLLIDLKAPGGAAPPVTGFGKGVTEERIRGVMGHRRATSSAVALSAVIAVAIVTFFATTAGPKTSETAPPDRGSETVEASGQVGQAPELTVDNIKPGELENIPAHLPEKRNEDTEPAKPEHPLYKDPAGPAIETYETYVIRPGQESDYVYDTSVGGNSD